MTNNMDAMDRMFLEAVLTAFGRQVTLEFSDIVNRYPPEMRPVVIGQMEALVAATKATFSEKDIKVADEIRDLSRVVTVVKDRPEA